MQKLKAFFKKLYYDQRVRFLFVGVLNTIVGVGVTWLVYLCFGVPVFGKRKLVWYVYLTGTLAGQIVGTVHSYFWNKYFTFRSKKKSVSEFFRFVLVYVLQYGLNLGLTALFNMFIKIPAVVTVITVIICTILSYFGHSLFSFGKTKLSAKKKEERQEEENKEENKEENNQEEGAPNTEEENTNGQA